MVSLPLKKLDFGLQKPTGHSSGVVASYNCFVFSNFFFFLHNSYTFQIVLGELQDTVLRTIFKKFRIVVVQEIIKNPNLVIKL